MLFLTLPTLNKVFGFYHVCLVRDWGYIVKDQIELILKSGLYDRTYKIFVSCLGTVTQRKHLEKMLPPKFKIVFFNEDIKLAEIPIMQYMQDLSKTDKFILWYIHTKGVTSGARNSNIVHWRKVMEYFIIERYKKCLQTVSLSKCDACGVLAYDLSSRPSNLTPNGGHFFAGNFWWSKSKFIRTLPNITQIFNNDRGVHRRAVAEMLFTRRKGARFYSFFQKIINIYHDVYGFSLRRQDYVKTNHLIKIPFMIKFL